MKFRVEALLEKYGIRYHAFMYIHLIYMCKLIFHIFLDLRLLDGTSWLLYYTIVLDYGIMG